MYNVYISNSLGSFNIFAIDKTKLAKVVEAYLEGKSHITVSGQRYSFGDLTAFRIFTYDLLEEPIEVIRRYLRNVNYGKRGLKGAYLSPATLSKMGKEVTDDFIGDFPYGATIEKPKSHDSKTFVHESRIAELEKISSKDFDLTRLVKLCKELNDNFRLGNWLSVGMIGRTIIHHVPPIFGCNTFEQVASTYGGPKEHRSFKKNLTHLHDSLKHIADGFLHQTIRKKESLPNETQIDFRQDMDVLLCEIVRILK